MTLQDAILNILNIANEHGIVVKMWTADDVADEIQQREEFLSMSRKEYRRAIADAMDSYYFDDLAARTDSDRERISRAVTDALDVLGLG